MAFAEKRGNGWRGRYRGPDGVKITAEDQNGRKLFKTKREALEVAKAAEVDISRGKWVDPSAGRITFSEYFEKQWLPHRVIELNTVAMYRSHYNSALRPEFGDVEIRKITSGMIQRWISKMQKAGLKERNIQAKFRALQTVLAAQEGVSAIRDGIILVNPCAGVTIPKVDPREVSVWEVEEADRIFAAMSDWWRPLAQLAVESGLRWGELLGLQVNDLSHESQCISVNRTIIELRKADLGGERFKVKPRPKGGKARTVWISPEAATAVQALVKERKLFGKDRLFSMPDKDGASPLRADAWLSGVPIGRSFWRESVWRKALTESGVEIGGRRFHDLRGSHISWALAGGADPLAVMKQAGHRDLSTTMLYADALADSGARVLAGIQNTRSRARKQA